MRIELTSARRRCGSRTARRCAPPPASRRTPAGGWWCRTTPPMAASGATARAPGCGCFSPVRGLDSFDEASGTKELKPDLEAVVSLPGGRTLALGSGSTPARMRWVLLSEASILVAGLAAGLRPDRRRARDGRPTSSTSRAPAWSARSCAGSSAGAVGRGAQRQRRRLPRQPPRRTLPARRPRCGCPAMRRYDLGASRRGAARRHRRGQPSPTGWCSSRRRRGLPLDLRRRPGGRLRPGAARRRPGGRPGRAPAAGRRGGQGRGAGRRRSARRRARPGGRRSTPTTPRCPRCCWSWRLRPSER